MEPIRQVRGDGKREKIMVTALQRLFPHWKFYDTPKFYFTDFHLTHWYESGRENYIGDLEIKWLKSDSSKPAIFPFNKLQQMLIAPPYVDSNEAFHRICFRFSDGILIVPARELGNLHPVFHMRWDTRERDLVIYVSVEQFKHYWIPEVVNEE